MLKDMISSTMSSNSHGIWGDCARTLGEDDGEEQVIAIKRQGDNLSKADLNDLHLHHVQSSQGANKV